MRAIDNRDHGIHVGDNAIVMGNLAVGNEFGILAGVHAIVSGNTSTGNSQRGFVIECPSAVVGNMARGNPTPFVIFSEFDCTFANNNPATP